jgi:acetyl esterase/lipase
MPSKAFENLMQALTLLPESKACTLDGKRINLEEKLARLPMAEGVTEEVLAIDHIPAQWLIPKEIDADLVVLYLHGGGYCLGSNRTHRSMVSHIVKGLGARVLMIEYRLAPEHPFPAALEDAVRSYRWLLSQGHLPENIIVAGDSAGGGLAVAALVRLKQQHAPLPAAGVCLSPWADLSAAGESYRTKAEEDPIVERDAILEMADLYLAGQDRRTPLASPLFADLSGLPPLLIQVGSAEVLLDDSRRLSDRARAAGVDVVLEVWDEMVHVWQLFSALLPEGREALEAVVRFIRQKASGQVDQSFV